MRAARSRKKVEPGWLTAGEVGEYAAGVNGESIRLNDRSQLEKLPE